MESLGTPFSPMFPRPGRMGMQMWFMPSYRWVQKSTNIECICVSTMPHQAATFGVGDATVSYRATRRPSQLPASCPPDRSAILRSKSSVFPSVPYFVSLGSSAIVTGGRFPLGSAAFSAALRTKAATAASRKRLSSSVNG